MRKRCTGCGRKKRLVEFYVNRKSRDGRTAKCATCCREENAVYRATHAEQVAARKAAYQRKNRDRLRLYYAAYDAGRRDAQRIKTRLHKYGLTREEYDKLVAAANGRCQICKTPCDKLQIEHCHASGTVRGLVCPRCNRGLAVFRDNKKLVAAAATFLNV